MTNRVVRRAETFQALGGFVVGFSGLMRSLEAGTLDLVGPASNRLLLEAALADRTAAPIIAGFFSVFAERWKATLEDTDRTLIRKLREEIEALVKIRNRLVHDAWMTSTGSDNMVGMRMKATREGAETVITEYSPEILASYESDAMRLGGCIRAMVWRMLPGDQPGLSAKLKVADGRIYRTDD